jgi:hypothetical protein
MSSTTPRLFFHRGLPWRRWGHYRSLEPPAGGRADHHLTAKGASDSLRPCIVIQVGKRASVGLNQEQLVPDPWEENVLVSRLDAALRGAVAASRDARQASQ